MSTVVKRVVVLSVLLGVFGLILHGCTKLNWSEAEKSYRIENADVDVQVNDDASLHVTEHLTFDFDGSFTGAYRDIPLAEGVTARHVEVSEGGEAYDPGGNTTLGSFDFPGTFGAEQLQLADRGDGEPTGGFRVVWHYDAIDEDRTFDVSYDVEGAATAYDDVVYVPWAVWGSQWEFWLDDLHAQIHLADGDDEPLDTHLRPRSLGADPEAEPGGATVDVERLPSGDEAVLSAVFPRSAFSSVDGAQVETGSGLDKVRADEAEVDDDENIAEKISSAVSQDIVPIELGWTLLVIAAAFGLYFLAREVKVAAVPKYLPEPPEDISPALAYALAEEGEFDDRLVLATLLDLVDRGYFDAKPSEGKEMDLVLSKAEKRPPDSGLEKYERKTMDFFDGLLDTPCPLGGLSDRIPKHSAKWRAKWESLTVALDEVDKSQLGWTRELVNARFLLATVSLGVFVVLGLAYYARTHLVVIPIFFTVAGLSFIYLLPEKWLKRMNPASRERNLKWNAFARWTKDFPRLSDDPPATLKLWRRIMVYAVAFGTAERLIGSGRIPAPVLEEASSSNMWLYTPLYGQNTGFTPNFEGFASGFASQVAPEASSSSGGGGGFSGGGGGFSGGGGGGAW